MKYFIGFMVTVMIIIILLVVSLGNVNKKPQSKSKDTTNKSLISYASSDASVRMIVDGPVSANETHYQISVMVDRNKTVYEQINGYNGRVLKSKTFHNNQNSFTDFLSALQRAGYMKGDKSQEKANYNGACGLSNRYIFSLNEGGKTIQQFWTSDCGSPKTYLGNFYLTYELFQAQVPDYSDLTSDINLY